MRGRRAPARISGGRGRVLGVEVGDQGVPQLETGLILVDNGGPCGHDTVSHSGEPRLNRMRCQTIILNSPLAKHA